MTQTANELVEEFEWLASHLDQGYEEPLRASIPLIADNVLSNFDNAQTAGGFAWPPRKDSLPHSLLVKGGGLKAAAIGTGPNHIETITENSLEFGVGGISYAARQNYGDTPGSRDSLGRSMRIPQREYMAISDGTVEEISEMFADFQQAKFIR